MCPNAISLTLTPHYIFHFDKTRSIDGDFEQAKEYDRTVEYTVTYTPKESWKILAGVKLEYTYESDIDEGDFTDREIYCKIEKNILIAINWSLSK